MIIDLKHRPFAITPDIDFMYWSESHKRAYDTIRKELLRKAPVTLLTGQVGTGKTLLINALIKDPEISEKFRILLMSNMFGDSSEVQQRLLLALRKKPKKPEAMRAEISATLQKIRQSGLTPLIIADEAQTLSAEGADELAKIAGNPEHGKASILISGQPEVCGIIKRAGYERLQKQIGTPVRLSELKVEDTLSYIRARLSQAGVRKDVFTPDAARLIHNKAKGIPRLINKLCEAMLFLATQEGSKKIGASVARRFLDENIDPMTLSLQSFGGVQAEATGEKFAVRSAKASSATPVAKPVEPKISVPVPVPLAANALMPATATPKAVRGNAWAMVGLAAGLAALLLPLHPSIHEYLDRSFYGKFGTGTLNAEIEQLTAQKQAVEQDILNAESRLSQFRETERLLASQARTTMAQIDSLQKKVAEEEAILETLRDNTEKAALFTEGDTATLTAFPTETMQAWRDQTPAVFVSENALLQDDAKDFSPLIADVERVPSVDAVSFFNNAIDQIDRREMVIGYARAALGGHRRAAHYLGQLYETGDGVTFSPAVAERWYELAEGQNPQEVSRDGLRFENLAGGSARPLFSAVENKVLDLVWDGNGTDFVVEFADAGGHLIGRFETPLTAARLTQPEQANSWRVRASDADTASAWHVIAAQGE